MVAVFRVWTFARVIAKTFWAESAFEDHTFPATLRVAPEASVPIPTRPRGPVINAVLSVVALALVVAKTFWAASAFEVHAFPATFRVAAPPVVFRPMKPPVVPYRLVTFRDVVFEFEVKRAPPVVTDLDPVTAGFTFPEKIE
jgi:hypothetical protein